MTTWTLTVTGDRPPHTLIGQATSPRTAAQDIIRAANSLTRRRGGPTFPRYEIQLGDDIVAIVQTGSDDIGLPDHQGAAQLIRQLDSVSDPYAP